MRTLMPRGQQNAIEKEVIRLSLRFDAQKGPGAAKNELQAAYQRLMGTKANLLERVKASNQGPSSIAAAESDLDQFTAQGGLDPVQARKALIRACQREGIQMFDSNASDAESQAPSSATPNLPPPPVKPSSAGQPPAPLAAVGAGAGGLAFNTDVLRVMIDAVFGNGTAAQACRRPIVHAVQPGKGFGAVAHSAYQTEKLASERREELRRQRAREASTSAKEEFETLRDFLFQSGVNVPRLSFNGLSVREGNTLDPQRLQIAQKHVDEFMAALNCTEAGARSQHPAARKARDFVRAQNGGNYTVRS